MSDPRRRHELLQLVRGPDPFEPERFRQVFCNRDLNLERIDWVGFDMDYTLAIYHREAFDGLGHRLTLEALVRDHGMDDDILAIPFDPDFTIRGLVLDTKAGHILKMDAHGHVGKGYHGFRMLDDEERAVYRRDRINLSSDRYRLLDTLFQLPEAHLFAALVDFLELRGEIVDYAGLADKIRAAMDAIHADGSLNRAVTADLPRYIERDPDLAIMLHRFRSAGKRLFLMTNSYPDYTDRVMTYMLEGTNESYSDWRGYFEVIITAATKPRFFRDGTPFRRVGEDGAPGVEEHERLERGALYFGGNLRDFERMIGLGSDELLYIGDHIYGDILRSKRDSSWRTVMIIPEMERELRQARSTTPLVARWNDLEHRYRSVNETLHWDTELQRELRAEHKRLTDEGDSDAVTELRHADRDLQHRIDELRRQSKQLLLRLLDVERQYDRAFHPRWGSLFKEGNEHSMFGAQVEDFACLYTSRASNFSQSSPVRYFRSPRNLLPHEMGSADRDPTRTI